MNLQIPNFRKEALKDAQGIDDEMLKLIESAVGLPPMSLIKEKRKTIKAIKSLPKEK